MPSLYKQQHCMLAEMRRLLSHTAKLPDWVSSIAKRVQAMELLSVSQQTDDVSHEAYECEKAAGHIAPPMMAGLAELLHKMVRCCRLPLCVAGGTRCKSQTTGPMGSCWGFCL